MAIRELAVSGYRSIRELRLPLRQINVLTGPNGCGKSNLYNAMLLLGKAAAGRFGLAIAQEGGMPSVLWAGRERGKYYGKRPPRRVVLSVTTDDFGYELQCGLPQGGPPHPDSQFKLDPEVKEETVWIAGQRRRTILMERGGLSTVIRGTEGQMMRYPFPLLACESVLSQIQAAHLFPELAVLRDEMRRWRFYHHFRTDHASPLRRPQIGVLTPVLSDDGADLAAALETIVEIGDAEALHEAVDRAFPGARLQVQSEETRFHILLHQPGMLRPLGLTELSDGTLRYLCLIAALLSPRPPALLALNEPETSLHPDLLAPLGQLITRAARESQLWITTHSRALAEHVERLSGETPVELRLVDGETRLA